MKLFLMTLATVLLFSACKHPRNYYLPKSSLQTESKTHTAKAEKPADAKSVMRTPSRTASAEPANDRVAVEIIKQMQLGTSIEHFVANVYTRVGNRKTYLATKMPCQASRGTSNDEGMFSCQFMPNDMDLDVKIVRGGTRTASLTIPGDPTPHEMNCNLKYDLETFQNRGPEATKAGSVLHRLQEVTCTK